MGSQRDLVFIIGAVDIAPAAADVRLVAADEAISRAREATYIVLDSSEPEAAAILSVADVEGVPVALVTERLDLPTLANAVLAHPSVDVPLERSLVGRVDVDELVLRLRPRPVPAGDLVEIGAYVRMPGTPDAYERQRAVSLASPKMRQFFQDLRDAIRTMQRQSTPRLRWEPTDAAESIAVASGDGERPMWRLDPSRVGRRRTTRVVPPLSDLYRCCDDPTVRNDIWCNSPGTDARKGTGWERVPPPLLVLGDSGTGKTLVAQLAHAILCPARTDEPTRPFVTVNSAGLLPEQVDHRLFGSAPNQWTGIGEAPGLAARAAYGTLFLDEIGDTPPDTQASLLHLVEDRMIRPTGIAPWFSFVQVVAATNRPLEEDVSARRFRHDLLARFGLRVQLPSLAERGAEEIRRLIDFVAQEPQANPPADPLALDGPRLVTHFHVDAMTKLLAHPYAAGNFRELEQVVHRAVFSARRHRAAVVLPEDVALVPHVDVSGPLSVQHLDRQIATGVPLAHDGDVRALAARRSALLLRDSAGRVATQVDGTWFFHDPSS